MLAASPAQAAQAALNMQAHTPLTCPWPYRSGKPRGASALGVTPVVWSGHVRG
jgi:hypothetical protein